MNQFLVAYVNIYDVLPQRKCFLGERFEDMVHMTVALEIHFTLEHNEISIKDLRNIVRSHNFNLNLSKKRENSSFPNHVELFLYVANTYKTQVEHFHVAIRNGGND